MWPHKDSAKLIAIHYTDSNYVIHLINRLVILSWFLPGVIRLFVPRAVLYLFDQISWCHLSQHYEGARLLQVAPDVAIVTLIVQRLSSEMPRSLASLRLFSDGESQNVKSAAGEDSFFFFCFFPVKERDLGETLENTNCQNRVQSRK